MFGLMEAGRTFSSIGGFEVAGAGVYSSASELAFDGFDMGNCRRVW